MGTQTTGEVAAEIGCSEPWLQYLMRYRKCSRPSKRNGKYVWMKPNKDEARSALAKNPEPKR